MARKCLGSPRFSRSPRISLFHTCAMSQMHYSQSHSATNRRQQPSQRNKRYSNSLTPAPNRPAECWDPRGPESLPSTAPRVESPVHLSGRDVRHTRACRGQSHLAWESQSLEVASIARQHERLAIAARRVGVLMQGASTTATPAARPEGWCEWLLCRAQ